MDGAIIIGFLVIAAFFALPILALVLAAQAKTRVVRLEQENQARAKELRYLYERLNELEKSGVKPPIVETKPIVETPVVKAEEAPTQPTAPAREPEAATAPEPAPEAPEPPRAPTPKPTPPPYVPPPPPPAIPLEQRFSFWFVRIGAGAMLLALIYSFKEAVDQGWIGPTGRVAIGVIAGVITIALGEGLKKSTRAGFVQVLIGLGLAFIFVAIYASSAFYGLIGVEAAFAANALLLLIGSALAYRHKGEPILILVLIAAFLNPVLLSTGVDRPFALFAYLFVITSVTIALSVRLKFAFAIGTAVLGTAILFAGWYERFFEVFDHRATAIADLPAEQLVGAYHAIGPRIVPFVFVALFAAQWIAAGFVLLQKEAKKALVLPLILASLLLTHAGWAALLYDKPFLLGGAMVLAAAGAIAALWKLERTDLLLVPMTAAFLLLSLKIGDTPTVEQQQMLLLLGAWAALYVLAFLRSASEKNQEISPGAAIRSTAALGVFALLGALMLLPSERSLALALLFTAVSAVVAVIAYRAKLLAIVGIALLASIMTLGVAARLIAEQNLPLDAGFLATVAVWAAIHMAAILWAAAKGRDLKWADLLTLSAGPLGFVLLSLSSTRDDVSMLRAILTGLGGLADFGAALYIANKRPELKGWVSVLSAQALGFFATAIGFALSGATITVLWAMLTAVAAMILARSKQNIWGVALVLLTMATLIRLVGIDLTEIEDQLRQFEWSQGRSGIYQLTPLLNPRAFALVGTGVAFAATALALLKGSKMMRAAAPIFAVMGYSFLIGAVISEARNFALALPEPPAMLLDQAEFFAFWATVTDATLAQQDKLGMITTVTLALSAISIVGLGFALNDRFHRYLGLVIFVATIAKLATWDIRNLDRAYQIVVLAAVGALLLITGFMYARLKTLFTRGRTAAGLILAGALALQIQEAQAQEAPKLETHRFKTQRAIEGVNASGDHRFLADLDLYRASAASELLADLRIATIDQVVVPHVIRLVPPQKVAESRWGRIFDPGEIEGGGYRALFEVPPGNPHCEVRLSLSGSPPYLRRTKIETGESPRDLQLVAEGAPVYAIAGANVPETRHNTINYPSSIARYVRITLEADPQASLTEIRGAEFLCVPPDAIAPVDRFPLAVVKTERDAEKKRTFVELDAGAEGVPIERLHLEVKTGELVRPIIVAASSFKSVWPPVASGLIFRVRGEHYSSESLSIHVGGVRKRWLRLEIEDRDDLPLELGAITAELPRREVLFRTKVAGPHLLYTGDAEARAPSYDLESIYARGGISDQLPLVNLGPTAPNPAFGKERIAEDLPFTERHRGPIGIGLTVLLLGVAVWAVKMLRSEDRSEGTGT